MNDNPFSDDEDNLSISISVSDLDYPTISTQ